MIPALVYWFPMGESGLEFHLFSKKREARGL